jgi:hypothetical protein
MKSDILVGLIKEVVKTEVKHQVKEELIKLIKSGIVTVNKESTKKATPSLKDMSEVYTTPNKNVYKNSIKKSQPVKEFTKDPFLNEILNSTTPFTSAQRAEVGSGGSILDALQPSITMEEGWETMDYRETAMPAQPMPVAETDNPAVDALTKALTRDYRELVKRFK